ncbi:MAG: FkbM family methyltransferase [Candidatus Sumerlaeia bacterium]|nr:FkbM family methyltransferase [Candidatus Sumerlaeia bacterium]
MSLPQLFSQAISQFRVDGRTLLWKAYRSFGKSVTLQTKQGRFTLPLTIDDPISKSLFIRKQFEHDIATEAMKFIRQYRGIPKGQGTIVDIGANNGVISIGMLTNKELSKAVCIEPAPQNFAYLTHNIALNKLSEHVTTLNFAVSDSETFLDFELSSENYGDHRIRKSVSHTSDKYNESQRKVIQVPCKPLQGLLQSVDSAVTNQITVFWMDVQGHEGYIFRGAKDLFSTGIPLVTEVWPYGLLRSGMSLEEYAALVQEIWSFYWVKRRGRFIKYPTQMFSPYLDELGSDGYSENIILTQ